MKAAYAPAIGAMVAVLCLSAAPARAGDDGQASLLSGIADSVGLSGKKDPQIDYRERGRLVLPPKKELPPPGSSAGRGGAWPTDVEAVREKKLKQAEDAEPSAKDVISRNYQLIKPGEEVKVTTSGFEGSHAQSCRVPDPKTGECPETPHASLNWNPMTWVGLQKNPPTVLGPEPERESLTDPPKGYRQPVEGVGTKIQN
jgi:hypothetical protein